MTIGWMDIMIDVFLYNLRSCWCLVSIYRGLQNGDILPLLLLLLHWNSFVESHVPAILFPSLSRKGRINALRSPLTAEFSRYNNKLVPYHERWCLSWDMNDKKEPGIQRPAGRLFQAGINTEALRQELAAFNSGNMEDQHSHITPACGTVLLATECVPLKCVC